ncbi:MAG: EamA-like transporter family protein [Chthoniobacteraceae bacterium]|nr:EamA-like transporter family protein [Chthoniobacteraceae bacterium]
MSEPILSIRKPLDNLAATVMVGLCLCWGLQQVAIKAAASSMEPVLQVGLRSLFAALLVAGLMIARRENLSLRDGTFRPGLLVGILFGGEFLAVSLGLNFTTAGHMAVFLYTAPIFTALGLHWLVREEQMRRRQWTGLGMAFAGIALAFSGSLFTPGGTRLLVGDMLGVLGGILWAATTLTIRVSRLSETSAAKTLLYQLSGAAILLLPIAWCNNDSGTVVPSPILWASLVFQTVVVAFTSFLLWFWLLRKYLASRLSIFSFLTPLFGVLFGVLFLKEPLDPRFVLGAMLVLAGITIVNRK